MFLWQGRLQRGPQHGYCSNRPQWRSPAPADNTSAGPMPRLPPSITYLMTFWPHQCWVLIHFFDTYYSWLMVLLSLFADNSFPWWISGSIWGFLIKTMYCTTLSFICIMCRGKGSTSGSIRFIVPWSSVYLICSKSFEIKICLLCKDSFYFLHW